MLFRTILFSILLIGTALIPSVSADPHPSAYGFDILYGYVFQSEDESYVLMDMLDEEVCTLLFNRAPHLTDRLYRGRLYVFLGRPGRYSNQFIVHDMFSAYETYGRLSTGILGYQLDDYQEEYGSASKYLNFVGAASSEVTKLKTPFVVLIYFVPDSDELCLWEVINIAPDLGRNREYHVGLLQEDDSGEMILITDSRKFTLMGTKPIHDETLKRHNGLGVKVLGFSRFGFSSVFMIEKIERPHSIKGELVIWNNGYHVLTDTGPIRVDLTRTLRNELLDFGFERFDLLKEFVGKKIEIFGSFNIVCPWLLDWPKEEPLPDDNNPALRTYDLKLQR